MGIRPRSLDHLWVKGNPFNSSFCVVISPSLRPRVALLFLHGYRGNVSPSLRPKVQTCVLPQRGLSAVEHQCVKNLCAKVQTCVLPQRGLSAAPCSKPNSFCAQVFNTKATIEDKSRVEIPSRVAGFQPRRVQSRTHFVRRLEDTIIEKVPIGDKSRVEASRFAAASKSLPRGG